MWEQDALAEAHRLRVSAEGDCAAGELLTVRVRLWACASSHVCVAGQLRVAAVSNACSLDSAASLKIHSARLISPLKRISRKIAER